MGMDASKVTLWNELRQRDLKVFARWLNPQTIDQAACLAGVTGLVLKLVHDDPQWAGSALAGLQRRGQQQARAERRSKHDPRGADPCMVSEEAFVQARKKMPWNFWVTLLVILTAGFEKAHGDSTRWKNFRLLALDGTTINLENWRRL